MINELQTVTVIVDFIIDYVNEGNYVRVGTRLRRFRYYSSVIGTGLSISRTAIRFRAVPFL